MSSKFSRRYTRVQRTPKVCISEKKYPAPAPPPGRTFSYNIGGTVTVPPGPPAKTFSLIGSVVIPATALILNGTDSAGNPVVVTLNVPNAPGSITGSLLWSIPGRTTTGTYLDSTWGNAVSELANLAWTPTSSPSASGGGTLRRDA